MNTLVGIQQALELGVDVVEVDLRVTRDDEVVLLHDATVNATTDGHGAVCEMTLTELKRLDAGSWKGEAFRGERIPTLREALELARGRAMLNLDMKAAKAIPLAIRQLRESGFLRDAVVSGCTERLARLVRDVEPSITVCLDSDDDLAALAKMDEPRFIETAIGRALSAGLCGLNFNHVYVTPNLVRAARMRGLAVWTWTVDDPVRMRELADMGVDSITSNYPRRLLEVLGR
jgi:glycerophosphoryl diester phosphodiesterase